MAHSGHSLSEIGEAIEDYELDPEPLGRIMAVIAPILAKLARPLKAVP